MSVRKNQYFDQESNELQINVNIDWNHIKSQNVREQITGIVCDLIQTINDYEHQILVLAKQDMIDNNSEDDEDNTEEEESTISFQPIPSSTFSGGYQQPINVRKIHSGAGGSDSDNEEDDGINASIRSFHFDLPQLQQDDQHNYDDDEDDDFVTNPDEIQKHVPSFSEIMLMKNSTQHHHDMSSIIDDFDEIIDLDNIEHREMPSPSPINIDKINKIH